jgi:hypothetical protein
MMRAWGNRPDTAVIDEPFYAYYLEQTGKDHPLAAEVIASGETDWPKVAASLTKSPVPGEKDIFFQKQMTHHLLPAIDREWITGLTNCFLIRDPREVILSYIGKNAEPELEDLGFVQQLEIFNFVVGTSRCDVRGRRSAASLPPVIDARDVLENPERTLRLLCHAIGAPFDKTMLSWPPGLRETDGIWAKHWYDAVARSTSFEPYQPKAGDLPKRFLEIYDCCRECYEQLYQHRLN